MFLVSSHGVKGVSHGFSGGSTKADLNRHGFFENPARQPLNLGRDCGGKEEGLAFGGAEGDDAFHVWQEAHVQHAIDFIQHQVGQVGQMKIPLLHKVKKPSRGGDEDVDSAFDLLTLVSIAHSTIDQPDTETAVLGELFQCSGDLVSQLAGGLKNKGAKAARFFQMLEDGQGKGGSLTGACLGRSDDVFAGQSHRNGLGLDRGRLLEAEILHGFKNRGVESQRRKIHPTT